MSYYPNGDAESGDGENGSERYLSGNPLTWWGEIMTEDVLGAVLGLVAVSPLSDGPHICWNGTLGILFIYPY